MAPRRMPSFESEESVLGKEKQIVSLAAVEHSFLKHRRVSGISVRFNGFSIPEPVAAQGDGRRGRFAMEFFTPSAHPERIHP